MTPGAVEDTGAAGGSALPDVELSGVGPVEGFLGIGGLLEHCTLCP